MVSWGPPPWAKATYIFWAIKLTATSAMPGTFWQRIPFCGAVGAVHLDAVFFHMRRSFQNNK